jgi:hypothetical protein
LVILADKNAISSILSGTLCTFCTILSGLTAAIPPRLFPHLNTETSFYMSFIHHNYEAYAMKKTVKIVGQEKTAEYAPPL